MDVKKIIKGERVDKHWELKKKIVGVKGKRVYGAADSKKGSKKDSGGTGA